MQFEIRNFHLTDLPALYRICLETGDHGADASPFHGDPDLLGHMFVAPYAFFEPELCFILTSDEVPVGYCLGTRDSAAFRNRTEQEWFPALRKRYPLDGNGATSSELKAADHEAIGWIHEGIKNASTAFPAHLHINILPTGQKRGWGRKLIHSLVDALCAEGVRGVWLGVSTGNHSAIAFYQHLGFEPIPSGANSDDENTTILAMELRASS